MMRCPPGTTLSVWDDTKCVKVLKKQKKNCPLGTHEVPTGVCTKSLPPLCYTKCERKKEKQCPPGKTLSMWDNTLCVEVMKVPKKQCPPGTNEVPTGVCTKSLPPLCYTECVEVFKEKQLSLRDYS